MTLLAVIVISSLLRLSLSVNPIFCVAKCLTQCASNDDACDQTCHGLRDVDCDLELEQVDDLVIDSATYEHVNPMSLLIEWTAKFDAAFVIKYRENSLDPWITYPHVLQNSSVLLNKSQVCAKITAEITPVNGDGIGKPFTILTGQPELPSTVPITIEKRLYLNATRYQVVFSYNVTPGWEFAVKGIKPIFKVFNCAINPSAEFTTDLTKQLFTADFTLDKALSKDKTCMVGIAVTEHLICENYIQNKATRPEVVYIGCEGFEGCTQNKSCRLDYFCEFHYYHGNFIPGLGECPEKMNVTINWWEKKEKKEQTAYSSSYKVCKAVTHAMRFTVQNASKDIIYSLFKYLDTSANNTFVLQDVPFGSRVVTQGCEIFTARHDRKKDEDAVDLAVSDDFMVEDDRCTMAESMTADQYSVAVAVPLSVTLVVVLVVGLLVFRKSQRQRDKLRKMQSSLYNSKYNPRPEIADKWEIDIRCLQIFESEILGKGAFGKVCKGRVLGKALTSVFANSNIAVEQELTENMTVAVKVCHEIADDTTKREFRMEIELMKDLYSHPRLVNILYCITKVEPLSLVVEYCEKGDLLNFLRHTIRKYMKELQEQGIPLDSDDLDTEKVMCYKDVLSIGFQVADGMAYISQKGYVHRDLAARNVMVCDSLQNVKIGDFGLCRTLASETYVTKGGKLPMKWLALEAIERYEFGHSSDVWSYGIFMYEVVTLGDAPYPEILPEGDMRKTMLQYLSEGNRMPRPANCTDELYQIMTATWLAEPSERPDFPSLKETLRKQLEQIVQDETGDYGDYYITPNRNYYNDSVIEETEFLTLPENEQANSSEDPKSSADGRDQRIPSRNSGPLIVEEEHTV